MATINIGSLSFTHKGDYASGTAYVKNDVVYYSTNGNAYVAKTSTTGNAPTSTAHWDIFAAGSGGIWNAGLSLGSASQNLRVNSSGNALEFYTASGGAILQNKTAQYFGTTNAACTSTGVDVSTLHSDFDHLKIDITPASTSSKFLVQFGMSFAGNSSNYGCAFIQRGIASGTLTQLTGGSHMGNGSGDSHNLWSAQYFDAPNTTSVVNYRLFAKRHSGGQIQINDIGTHNSLAGGMYISVFEYDGSLVTVTNT